MKDVTIYHNPACGTSRNALALLRGAGVEPVVIEYLKNPPTKEKLHEIVRMTGSGVRPLLRAKESVYRELGLDDAKWSDDALIDFVLQHPILLNRPIVVTPDAARLCRPADTVLDLLAKKS